MTNDNEKERLSEKAMRIVAAERKKKNHTERMLRHQEKEDAVKKLQTSEYGKFANKPEKKVGYVLLMRYIPDTPEREYFVSDVIYPSHEMAMRRVRKLKERGMKGIKIGTIDMNALVSTDEE